MNTQLETTDQTALAIPSDVSMASLEMAVGQGDFSRFSAGDRLRYLNATCLSLKLNPLTLPIRIIKMDGREVMYATAECSAQLSYRDKVSVKKLEEKIDRGCYFVRVLASTPDGRSHEDIGVLSIVYPATTSEWRNGQKVSVTNPKAGKEFEGLDFANAVMKCHTKATRRAILRICSLGIPDETELDDMPRAQVSSVVNTTTETSSVSRAAKLNDSLEKETAVDAEVVPQKEISTNPVQATVMQPEFVSAPINQPAPEPNVVPQSVPSNTAQPTPGTAALLSEKEVMDLEIVLTERGSDKQKEAIRYMQFNKKLPIGVGVGLENLHRSWFGKIMADPAAFWRGVEGFIKSGVK